MNNSKNIIYLRLFLLFFQEANGGMLLKLIYINLILTGIEPPPALKVELLDHHDFKVP